MKVGTLRIECHVERKGDQIVVACAELDTIDAQLQRLSDLVTRYGVCISGARFSVGPYCTFGDGSIDFEVVCKDDPGDARFWPEQFIAWCRGLSDSGDPETTGSLDGQERPDTDRIEVLPRAEIKRLLATLRPSGEGYVDDIVERVTQAVRVTTSDRSYVIIDANVEDYAPDRLAPRPQGKPLGQMPLLPHFKS